jgi:peptidyl-prolyl cis-trans isomerase C
MRECQRERGRVQASRRTRRLHGRWVILACFLVCGEVLAQSPSPTGGTPSVAAPIPAAPVDLSRPVFDTQTRVYDPSAGRKAPDTVVAEVDGRQITLGEVQDLVLALPPQVAQQNFQILYPRVLEQLIYRTALAIRARQDALDNDPVLRRRAEAAADHIFANGWLHKYLTGKITEQMVLARYDRDVGSQPPPEEVRLRLYLAETEQQAKETIVTVRGGADFAALAQRSSTDPSATKGGDLGFLPWSAVIPELAGVAYGLATGEVAPVPIRTRFGWIVLRLEERRPGARPPFAQVRENMMAELEQEQTRSAAEDAMKDMVIRRFAFNGVEEPGPNAPATRTGKEGDR